MSWLAKCSPRTPADIARLVGVRGVFVRETAQGKHLDANRVKELVSHGEPLPARFMRENWFDFVPKFKLWLHTNNKPLIRDDTDGTWRRIYPVRFRHEVPKDQI